MSLFIFFISIILLFTIELLYFKIADKYNIIDKPNHRSSHTRITIRGGGIIFSLALLLGSFYWGFQYAYFLTGLLLISFISFVDDIKTVSNKVRILFHLAAVALLFCQVGMYSQPLYFILLGLVVVIGAINAINFMDGINGITGGYGLITLITLYYINNKVVLYTGDIYLILAILAVLVFNFFNFRKKAKCFAGDVGSVSMAFIMLFFLLQLIIKTNNFNYLLLLLVYGLDTVTTILLRIWRRENIFNAHRSHFYQFLANEQNIPHLVIATLYALTQGLLNIILIKFSLTSIVSLLTVITLSTVIFIITRLCFEGATKLFIKKN